MTTDGISIAVHQLCDDLNRLWQFESFSFTYYSFIRTPISYAKTVATPDAFQLPNTKFPVRGHDGVELTCPRVKVSQLEKTFQLIFDSYKSRGEEIADTEHKTAIRDVRATVEKLSKEINDDDELGYRLYGVSGYKSYSWDEFSTLVKTTGEPTRSSFYFSTIADILANELDAREFDSSKRQHFKYWNEVKERAVATINEIRCRAEYLYEVRIYLNGPPLDCVEGKNIANLHVGGTPVNMCISAAFDALLEPLVKYRIHPSLDRINTVLTYTFSVPVKAGEDTYLQEYSKAAFATEFVIDSLRLIRPTDDIGVLALEVIPTQKHTPYIRQPDDNRYRTDLAYFQPRRFDFSPSSLHALDENEIKRVRDAVNARLPINQRFEYAIGRFRNSIERYSQDDPERLLEWAIALETLYLNDNTSDHGELTYRLSIRAARFLKTDRDSRKQMFLIVRNLYSLRSKIAHGSDITQLRKNGDIEKLTNVLDSGSEIVASSILKLMQIPEVDDPGKVEFWRDIELS